MQNNFIIFPYLHKEYLSSELKNKAKLLNIGLAVDDENFFTPENLPMSYKEVKSYLNFCLEFGSQFKHIKDMQTYFYTNNMGLDSEGIISLVSELALRLKEDNLNKDVVNKNQEALKYQMVLILFYAYEEKIKEIIELEHKVKVGLDKIKDILGIEEDEGFRKDLCLEFMAKYELKLDQVLPAFDFYLSPKMNLLVTGENVFKELKDKGVQWQKSAENFGFVGKIFKGSLTVLRNEPRNFIYWQYSSKV
ncbi:MAG: hypothetical protein Q9M37_07945 [Desulfonauticus sp.]|nr:hypothetical protein [Desulfonauticus sp.]